MYEILENGTDESICRAGIAIQMKRIMDFWTQQGKEWVGRIERIALNTYITICK